MNGRHIGIIFLILLLSVAGCNALSEQSQAPPETTTPGNGQAPRGIADTGVTNETQLLQRHQTALSTTDYRIAYNLSSIRGRNVVNTTTIVQSNQSQRRQRSQSNLPQRTVDQYTSGKETYLEQNISGNVSYATAGTNKPFDETHYTGARPGELLQSIVSSANYTATGTERYRGRTVTVYNATNASQNLSTRLPDTVQAVRGQLKLGEDGRVWEASLLAGGVTAGRQHYVYQEYRVLNVSSVTIEEPTWISDAR